MNAVERVLHYADLPSEGNDSSKIEPSESWPSNGQITFNNVKMSYREGLPLVLKGVDIKVNPGEQVSHQNHINPNQMFWHGLLDWYCRKDWIRKELSHPSSPQVSFYFYFYAGVPFPYVIRPRIVELQDGSINIDGEDISKIDLTTLRTRLAFVPQDATLFLGTLRDNL